MESKGFKQEGKHVLAKANVLWTTCLHYVYVDELETYLDDIDKISLYLFDTVIVTLLFVDNVAMFFRL